MEQVWEDPGTAEISDKLKALLRIAQLVAKTGQDVTPDVVKRAQELGATDKEIHDTVLIAAAFCMFNRYVDGLATWTPEEHDAYRSHGKVIAEQGYVRER